MSNDWILEAEFASYDDASKFKDELIHSDKGAFLQIKIIRNNTKNNFLVKSRQHPELLEHLKEIEQKLAQMKVRKQKDQK